MDHGWGSFRTTDGDVSVGHDTLDIDKTIGRFLRGQRSRWRNGDRRQQILATFKILGLLLTPLFAIYQLYTILGTPIGVAAALLLATVVLNLIVFWWQHSRETTIRLSAIENAALDTHDRELTVTHEADGRLALLDNTGGQNWFGPGGGFSMFETGDSETAMTLLTSDDVREARTLLRTRGIPIDVDTTEPETETEYRFEMRNGVVFCDQCGSQVSPNDRNCPSCDRTLCVEQPAEADERERLVEF